MSGFETSGCTAKTAAGTVKQLNQRPRHFAHGCLLNSCDWKRWSMFPGSTSATVTPDTKALVGNHIFCWGLPSCQPVSEKVDTPTPQTQKTLEQSFCFQHPQLVVFSMVFLDSNKSIQLENSAKTLKSLFANLQLQGRLLASPVQKTHEHVLPGHVQASFDNCDNHWVACNAGKNVVRMVDGFWGCIIQSVNACYFMIKANYGFTPKLANTGLSRMFHVLSPFSSVYLSAKKMDCTAMTQWSFPIQRGGIFDKVPICRMKNRSQLNHKLPQASEFMAATHHSASHLHRAP